MLCRMEWHGTPGLGEPRVMKSTQRAAPLKEAGSSHMQKDCGMSCPTLGFCTIYQRACGWREHLALSTINCPRGAQARRESPSASYSVHRFE